MARKHELVDQLHNDDQKEAYRHMCARGYKPNDIERAGCVSLCKIEDDFLMKVRISRDGRIRAYSPIKATDRDLMMFV